MNQTTIGFIGSGNMGGALIRAACKGVDPKKVIITDFSKEKASELAKEVGCLVAENNNAVVESAKFIMLGVKPQMQADMLKGISETLKKCLAAGEEKVLVTFAAGITVETVLKNVGAELPVIRIMPNIPASVGMGMILVAGEHAGDALTEEFLGIMKEAGRFDRLAEKAIDAATVPAGCAPAYAYMFIEALADGAVLTGVPRAKAMEYAAQAVMGSAAMILEGKQHPGALKDAVCSPGGSTIVGVAALEEGGFRSACIKAIAAAYEKTVALGK